MINAYLKESSKPMNLSKAMAKKEIEIGRGRIIPKQSGQYPVYSSSAQNSGFLQLSNLWLQSAINYMVNRWWG